MTFIIVGIGAGVGAVVATIAAVAATIAATIAAVVGSIIVSIAATVYGVVSAISNVISPILDLVGTIVNGILVTLGNVLGHIIEAVGGVLETIATGIKTGVEAVTEAMKPYIKSVTETYSKLIKYTYDVVVTPFKPILIPIRDSLKYISDFITGTRAWIVTQLKPVGDLIGLINDISALATIKRLLTGQMEIAEILGDKSEDPMLNLATSIFVLYRNIVQTTTETLELTRNTYTRLRDTIDEFDERISKDMALAIEFAKATVQGEIDKVTDALSGRLTPMELEIAGIERRSMDLPFFQQMIIRSIE